MSPILYASGLFEDIAIIRLLISLQFYKTYNFKLLTKYKTKTYY